ncbi:MAG: hypothetical protein A2270_07315 [Elusimicrobia bacterium RIFOXYA12_FULL_51_18]|nr:MAG: hypothetical protein A2270_07315 [Elusimicrobia bacterium RIFOXYA12_FULL_51_18]OGS28491.1 MAG: hypothetical protein A2218_05620 [Elusimicrobia bacterium RIFOXYA2_FULL_53_38]
MSELQEVKITDIKHRSIKAAKWSALSEISTRLIAPIVTLILARLLAPSDFGVVSVATIAIGLAQTFQEFGFGKALIQTNENVEVYANNAFWINVGMGVFLYTAILFTAPAISRFFDSPQSIAVLRTLCLQLIFTSFSSVQASFLQRSMNFKAIFVVRLTSSFLPGIVSVVMALQGMGVWALVFGSLVGAITQAILYWRLSTWRPCWRFDLIVLKRMVMFSRWVLLEGVFAWLITWGDSVVLGHYLGVEVLGIYRVGSTAIAIISTIVFTPIISIAFSFFSRLQSNLDELKNSYNKLTQLIVVIAIPIGIGLALLSKPIVIIFLDKKWVGTEIVISIMAIRLALGWLVGLNSTVYTALARPDLNVKLLLLVTIISIPSYIFGAHYGLLVFCLMRLLTAIIDNCINYYIARNLLQLSLSTLLEPVAVALWGTAFMGASIIGIMKLTAINTWPIFIAVVLIAMISYLVSLTVIKKDFVIWCYNYGKQVLQ